MNDRFYIECNGIIDSWNALSGNDCQDRLTWVELCDTLNSLNNLADKNLDEYEYIAKLEKENQVLKDEISAIVGLSVKMEDYIHDIKIIANNGRGKND